MALISHGQAKRSSKCDVCGAFFFFLETGKTGARAEMREERVSQEEDKMTKANTWMDGKYIERCESLALTGGRTTESDEVVDVLQVLVRLAVAANQT